MTMPAPMPMLYTNRFQTFESGSGVPVRISNGAPRWRLPYDLTHAVHEVMPAWPLVKANLPHPEFAARYVDALEDAGLDVILSRFRAIMAAESDTRLVLMCFEDLSTGSTCHRTVFADWWERRTGRVVTELGKRPVSDATGEADREPHAEADPLF